MSLEKLKTGVAWTTWVAAALIVLFVGAVFSMARLKSVSSDEPPHIAAGLSYFVTHEIFRANPEHPPLLKELAALSLMIGSVRWPNTRDANYLVHGDDPEKVFPLEWPVGNYIIQMNGHDRVLAWARFPLMLVAGLLAVWLFLWGRQLFGSLAALAAVFVCVLDPTILAHSQFVTTDIGVASFSVLALFALWNYLQSPTRTRLVLCGLALGAALASKYSAVLLLPIFGILIAASVRWPIAAASEKEDEAPSPKVDKKPAPVARNRASAKTVRRKDLCPCGSGKKYKNCHGAAAGSTTGRKVLIAGGALLLMIVIAAVFVQATFFFPSDLMTYFKCIQLVNGNHNPAYQMYMAGGFQKHFLSYFLVAYLLKEPVASILLALFGLVVLIRSKSIQVLAKLFVLVPPAVFFAVTSWKADNLGIRYLMPCLPFAHLLAGLGIATLIGARQRFKWAPIAAAAMACWLVLAAVGVYPDHLSYFNETACLLTQPGKIGLDGGSRCGVEWLDDSNVDWGQGLKELKSWLARNDPGRGVNVAIFTAFPPEMYGIRGQLLKPEDLGHPPQPGLYAVSQHLVARVPGYLKGAEWLRSTKPVAIVGHAFWVYDIPGK
jgi:hypothetical protein